MSSSTSMPLALSKKLNRKAARKRRKLKKQILQDVVRRKALEDEDLVKTSHVSSPRSRSESDGIQYSQNWRALQQEMGPSSDRRHFLPPMKPRSHHRKSGECGESSRTSTTAPETSSASTSVSPHPLTPVTGNCLSLDCEMVGGGHRGQINMLARCSIVDCHGDVVYDTYVAPTAHVWDYRTPISGIRSRNLVGAPSFSTVQREVASLLRGRILVGHDIKHDLKALSLIHPSKDIRDTFSYKPFGELFGGSAPSLRKLAKKVLGIDIQTDEHSSVEDAQAAMSLYQLHKKLWDKNIKATANQ